MARKTFKLLFGVGINDLDRQTHTEAYKVWHSMIRRAYSSVYHRSKPAYKDVSVCEEWRVFSAFLPWFNENYIEGWQLDKDVLVKGNRVYDSTTCCFLPPEINSALIHNKSKTGLPIGVYFKLKNNKFCAQVSNSIKGRKTQYLGLFESATEAFNAYKVAKEAHLAELAQMFKDELRHDAYCALMQWQICITD